MKRDFLKVYCVHPISGLSYDAVVEYYERTVELLEDIGYIVLQPMTGKMYLQNETEFKTEGYDNPVSTNRAIKGRDKWMVKISDIVYANFVNAKDVSIGSCMEIAWAEMLGKHTVVVMGKKNPHRHAFILECADIIFETEAEALDYLTKLARGHV